jgi:hypothetical protein
LLRLPEPQPLPSIAAPKQKKLIETEGSQSESTAVVDEVINLKLFSEDAEI